MSFLKGLLQNLGLTPSPVEVTIAPLVSYQAHRIIESHTGRALFIDMGSNIGQAFRFFSKYYNPNIFDYWLVEPNPFCIGPLYTTVSTRYATHSWKGNWTIMNVAVSRTDGMLPLYGLLEGKKGKTSQGASVIKDHNSLFYASTDTPLMVASVRASKLIESACRTYSTLIVKMDIEASEYDVLEDLMSTGYSEKISRLYVEWHSQYLSDNKKGAILAREHRIKTCLSEKLTDWH